MLNLNDENKGKWTHTRECRAGLPIAVRRARAANENGTEKKGKITKRRERAEKHRKEIARISFILSLLLPSLFAASFYFCPSQLLYFLPSRTPAPPSPMKQNTRKKLRQPTAPGGRGRKEWVEWAEWESSRSQAMRLQLRWLWIVLLSVREYLGNVRAIEPHALAFYKWKHQNKKEKSSFFSFASLLRFYGHAKSALR